MQLILTVLSITMISVRNRSYSGPYFHAFGRNMESYSYVSIFSPNAEKYGPEYP